ncbi:MAG: baseplate J/gp47 family protein [Gammaproteobacteria bacterium]|nr:baseplate J/gp47 family protein [Alphaproteobacteria bacterium]MBU2407111.1 baseplate J/gp47 family protein [Gammaproteobacteria bacterium]
MPVSISTSTAVDLSRLPAPDVVEVLEYETILAAMLAELLVLDPTLDALGESDPATKVLQVAAYRELGIRQRVNEAARAVMVAYAAGADLDQLAAVFGVVRLELAPADEEADTPAVMESDEDLRRRVLLAPDSYSVAGPRSAYVFHALSADPEVLDASATSPAPGEVVVSVLSRNGDGTPPPEVLAAVEAAVNGDTVRPLTDEVTVQAAGLVPFDVSAELTLYAGPDRQLILETAVAALEAFLANARRLARDVPRSALIAALHVAGVQRVALSTPAADIVVSELEAPLPGTVSVTLAGTDE